VKRVRVATVLIGLVALIGAAAPARAHISALSLNDTGFWWPDRVWVAVSFTCGAGEAYYLRLNVKQTDPQTGELTFEGVGTAKGTCSGSPQGKNIPALVKSGTPETGDGVAAATMTTRAGAEPHSQRKVRRNISIVPD